MMRIQSGFNGKRLKAARLYRGLTISEVAKMSDVSKQAISQFENINEDNANIKISKRVFL